MGTVDIIIGKVIMVHIKDEFINKEGYIDIIRVKPVARLGYYDYTTVDSIFQMVIPGKNENLLTGLEGAIKRI